MRDEAPVYYNEEHDFYALTRHEDVAPAFKDFDTYSSALRRGPFVGQKRCADNHGHEDDHLHGPARAPNMRSLLNKVFTPRAIQAQTADGHRQGREVSEPPRPGRFRRRAGVHCAVPRRGHHHDVSVCQRTKPNRSDIGSMTGASRGRPGRDRREGNAGEHRPRDVLPRTGAEAASATPGRSLHQAYRGRPRARGRRTATSSTTSTSPLSQAFSAVRAPRR